MSPVNLTKLAWDLLVPRTPGRPDRVALLFLLAVLAVAGLEVWALVSLF